MRAMMSVGPPAGNPTTTRTGRFGYPCADAGATPVNSNRLARIPYKMRIVPLSLGMFLLATSSASARFGTRAKRGRSDTGSEGFEEPQRHIASALELLQFACLIRYDGS